MTSAAQSSSIPKEVLAQVRRIEIRTRRLVTESLGGKYLSVFKGRGMEFAEVREYVPGDDVRAIDWNVTARTGRPHIRQYQDERELTVMLACDLSGSQYFGSDLKLKKEVAAEIAAVLAFAALQNNDKIGLFLFTDEAELYIRPKKGRTHILSIIRNVLAFTPKRKGTSIAVGLDALNRHLKRRSILFLLSDFKDFGFESLIRRTALKHDLVPVVLEDPRESEIPAIGAWIQVEDPETGERSLINARSATVRRAHREQAEARRQQLTRLFQSTGLESIRIRTDRPYIDPLVMFFRNRSKRIR
ncbi:MAG: DUF58 domain-containing protein [Elusimicrobia bacterium]|nr:DUF58 domain-containing protein [Elusimicrobiota bacterium]